MGKQKTAISVLCSLLMLGCGSDSGTSGRVDVLEISTRDLESRDSIDPADLSPDDLVFAAARGGGFAFSVGHEFFWGHHPDFTLYVFGDRRVVFLDMGTITTLGYRVWKQATVPEQTFVELLALAVAVGPDDSGEYQRCPALDGPTEGLFVDLPGLSVEASCFSSFAGCPGSEGDEEDWETPPPDALVGLYDALMPLTELPAETIPIDQILLGVQPVGGPYWNCDATNATPWPFDEPEFPDNISENTYWSTTVGPPLGAEVRDFVRDHLDDFEVYYPSACVS